MEDYQLRRHKKRLCCLKLIGLVVLLIIIEIVVSIIILKSTCGKENETSLKNQSSLVFVQVLFRHGNRTPMQRNSYPTDPYKNSTYEPYGEGALTHEGEKKLYNVGKLLKKYYNSFLGEFYNDIVYTKSSPIGRCFNSVMLVLAGLFKPEKKFQIDDELTWRPIPYYYNPMANDFNFLFFVNCKKYITETNEIETKFIREDKIKGIKEFSHYLSRHTRLNITKVFDLFSLYDHLNVQASLGYELPEWAQKVYPEPFNTYRLSYLNVSSSTESLKKYSGGFLLKEIVDIMTLKVQNSPKVSKRKIQLYSGHDITMVGFLKTLGIKLYESPVYGSFVSIELHNMNGNYRVKVLYHNYVSDEPRVLKLPMCEEMCPLQQFIELYGQYLSSPEECK